MTFFSYDKCFQQIISHEVGIELPIFSILRNAYYFVENYSQIAHKNRKWNLSKCQGRGMWGGGQIFLLIFLGFQAILRRKFFIKNVLSPKHDKDRQMLLRY